MRHFPGAGSAAPGTGTDDELPGRQRRPGGTRRSALEAAATAAAVEQVALRLFDERGFDAVTVDEIATETNIGRRTFFGYFPSKEDVLFSDSPVYLAELKDAVAARPAEEPPITALRHAFVSLAIAHEGDRDRLVRWRRIVATSPTLQAAALGRLHFWEQGLAEVVARRLGVDPTGHLPSAVAAATTLAAMRVVAAAWLGDRDRGGLTDLVAEAFGLLGAGLQQVDRRASPVPELR
jgi:AcrR family transcriptional regulator